MKTIATSISEITDAERDMVERILMEHARVPFAYGEIRLELACDRKRDQYLLLMVGWMDNKRINGPLIHIELRGGKFWIEYDGTEEGVATDLLQAGIPPNRIVLGFQSPVRRQYSEFAIA